MCADGGNCGTPVGSDRQTIFTLRPSASAQSTVIGLHLPRVFVQHSTRPTGPWKAGGYMQTGLLVGRFEPALRYDMTRDLQDDTVLDHGIASVKATITSLWNVRAEVDIDLRDPAAQRPQVGVMSAFFF